MGAHGQGRRAERRNRSGARPRFVGAALAALAAAAAAQDGSIRAVEPVAGETIHRVYYATDRARWVAETQDYLQLAVLPFVALVLAFLGPRLARKVFRPAHVRVRQVLRKALWVGFVVITLFAVGRARRMYQARDRLQYGSAVGEVEYGLCQVSVPKEHVRGEIERPGAASVEGPESDLMVRTTTVLSEARFFPLLRERVQARTGPEVLGRHPRGQLLVFIHGYNVTFDAAARRAAQIVHDVGYAGPAVMYSWPSGGSVLDYGRDKEITERSAPRLQKFLESLQTRTGARKIHILAHSMGNVVLSKAMKAMELARLRQIAARHAMTSSLKIPAGSVPATERFHEIVLAAPDISVAEFNERLGPTLVQLGRRVTIYASEHDAALAFSKWWAELPRLGAETDAVRILGMDTVDASAVTKPRGMIASIAGAATQLATGELQHSYIAENPRVLSDLGKVLQGVPAAERPGLVRVARGHYAFAPDAAEDD